MNLRTLRTLRTIESCEPGGMVNISSHQYSPPPPKPSKTAIYPPSNIKPPFLPLNNFFRVFTPFFQKNYFHANFHISKNILSCQTLKNEKTIFMPIPKKIKTMPNSTLRFLSPHPYGYYRYHL